MSLRDGFLWERVDLPGFRERGGEWRLSLGYASYAAAPTATLFLQVNYNSTRPVERTLFEFEVAGVRAAANYGLTSNNQKPIGTWFWNGKDVLGQLLPTGSYPYVAVATSLNANTPVAIPTIFGENAVFFQPGGNYPGLVPLRTPEQTGAVIIVNQRNSPFGAGWVVTDEDRLTFDPDGCIVLTQGNSDWKRYAPQGAQSNVYTSPMGDYSTLRFNPATGTFRREFDDGSVHAFDATGRIQTKTDRYGATTTFTHAGGLLSTMTSPTGYSYAFGYQGGKIASITDSAGRQTQFTVNGVGDLIAITDVTGATRTFSYDSEHRLSGQVGARGERTEYLYKNGRISETRSYDVSNGPLLRRRQFSPSFSRGEIGDELAQGRGTIVNPIPPVTSRVNSYVDGEGATTLQETNCFEQPLKLTDPLGRVTQFTYDPDPVLTLASKIWPNGRVTEYDWTADGQLAVVREKASAGAAAYSTVTYQYEPIFKQISQVVDAEGKATRFFYDGLGNLTAVEDNDGHRTEFDYASLPHPQLLTEVELPTGDIARLTYDAHGNAATFTDFPDPLGQPAGRTTIWTRDNRGNASAITNALGKSVQVLFDTWDRAISVTDPLLATTLYDYNDAACGCSTPDLTKVTFANASTMTFDYDGLGRRTRRTDQLGKFATYEYDAEGRLVEFTDRNGDTVEVEYDLAGQLLRRTIPPGEVTTFAYNSVGELLTTTWPDGQLSFTYDFLGRMTSATSITDILLPGGQTIPDDHVLTYTYDRNGNRLSYQDDTGALRQNYTYDNQGRPATINVPSQAALAWTFGYDDSGRRTSLTPAGSAGSTNYTYDRAGQLTSVIHGTTPTIAFLYPQYDAAGRLTASVAQLAGQTIQSAYTYDDVGQLTRANASVTFGNAQVNRNYTVDAANRLLSDREYTYTYDDEGRMVSRTTTSGLLTEHFLYDALGQLRQLTQVHNTVSGPQVVMTADYSYDPLGRRRQKVVNGVAEQFLYDREDVLAKYDGFGRLDASFVHGPGIDEPLAVRDVLTGVDLFARADRLGSLAALSNAAGQPLHQTHFGEFGDAHLRPISFAGQTYGFTGREQDVESGLMYFRSRSYLSHVGRFVRQDSLGLYGGLNLYAYVGNRPTDFIDPYGTKCLLPIGSLIGGGLKTSAFAGCVTFGLVGAAAGSSIPGLGTLGGFVIGCVGGGGVFYVASHLVPECFDPAPPSDSDPFDDEGNGGSCQE